MSLDPGGQQSAGVLITIGQVYNVVTETQKDMRELAGHVHQAVATIGDHEARLRTVERVGATSQEVDELRKDFALQMKAVRDEYGPRMGSVERRVWMACGAAAAVSGSAAALLSQLLGKH